MTFEKLAQIIADEFKQVMQEEDFDTFEEMKDCYWWDTEDIKNEIEYYFKEVTEKSDCGVWFSDDRTDVYIDDDYISYRKFSTMWHKAVA